ncbi:MAG: hypothetical protein JXN65_11070 [Clostridia bacterium]|nr:hypothetical protein [Clostridia bacterium]
MRRFIYIVVLMLFIVAVASGCVNKDAIEEMQRVANEIEEDIEQVEDENENLEEEIESLITDKEEAIEYNEEIKQKVDGINEQKPGEFQFTFQEYFAQILYLCRQWDMDIFNGPLASQMDNSDYLEYVFKIEVNDETCTGIEVHVFTEKKSDKVLQCTLIIYQDEVYRMDESAYGSAFRTVTEIALSALVLAGTTPFEESEITLAILNKIQENDIATCAQYNIGYAMEADDEAEIRSFFPYK